MKRSPLPPRRKPLRPGRPPKRKTWLRSRREKPRRDGRVHDPVYLAFVRTLPCCVDGSPHAGRIDPHHAGEHPAGRKADDDTAIPMCRQHHDQWDAPMWSSSSNPFREWGHDQRRRWQDDQIAETRAAWYISHVQMKESQVTGL